MTPEQAIEINAIHVPLSVNFDDISYKEVFGDNKSAEIMAKIESEKVVPTTSQPSPQDFIDEFSRQIKLGYERLIVLTISSKLSGTYQGAISAAELFIEDNPSIIIDVFDSLSGAQVSSQQAFEIEKVIRERGSISNEEIQKIIDWYTANTRLFLALDTLDNLIYGGRIGKASGMVGSFLGFKPILELVNGELEPLAKPRSKKKAMYKLLETFNEDLKKSSFDKFKFLTLFIDDESGVNMLKKEIIEKYPNVVYEDGGMVGPILGVHVGPGTTGVV